MPPDKEIAKLVQSLDKNTQETKQLRKICETLNANLVQLGQMMKDSTEESSGD